MDYEKKYKQSLELARDYYKANLMLNKADENLILEDIFPELAERDDEKIKKVLIDYFNRYKEQEECGINTFYGIPTDNILAWLEKQATKGGEG